MKMMPPFAARTRSRHSAVLLLAATCTLLAAPAAYAIDAADFTVSGFGTVGYARSNAPYNYQRFISDQGTLKRDSLFGLQLDARLADEFRLTVQARLAPAADNDSQYAGTVSWAFLSWHPTNDWLVRAGRVRVPLYMISENTDVGATFDFARLPAEVYATSPTTDLDGASFAKTWNLGASELTLDGYAGRASNHIRIGSFKQGPLSIEPRFLPFTIDVVGVALTLVHNDNTYRLGALDSDSAVTGPTRLTRTFPFVQIAPGIGYFQTSPLVPGPGLEAPASTRSLAYTLGANIGLGDGYRVMGEFVRRDVRDLEVGPASRGAYLALLKTMGPWTPYVSTARLLSSDTTLSLYNRVNSNRVPAFIPGADQLNLAQAAGAAGIFAYDQTTLALGTSYRVTTTSKFKAEWARTRIGDVSAMVDPPVNESSGHRGINVFSLSYNFAF